MNKQPYQLNMKIDVEMKKKFHIACTRNGTSMSKVIRKAIMEYIKQNES